MMFSDKTEDELDEMVEYDLDSEDENWLKQFNDDMKKEGTKQNCLTSPSFERG
jgi:hypothetical protein